ncbi:MAG: hypothetical protein QNJ46_16635 [Leptolyngbyaceae cyanobacterium MO_188.B28]|nr:hypothetical protein [Leptolyngbyaceae cyanobacterium MO_188.B28]
MLFQKKPETVPTTVDSDTVWETLQSLQMLEKNRQAVHALEEKLQRMRWSLVLSIVLLGGGMILALGGTGWNMYQLHQLQQAITTNKLTTSGVVFKDGDL